MLTFVMPITFAFVLICFMIFPFVYMSFLIGYIHFLFPSSETHLIIIFNHLYALVCALSQCFLHRQHYAQGLFLFCQAAFFLPVRASALQSHRFESLL